MTAAHSSPPTSTITAPVGLPRLGARRLPGSDPTRMDTHLGQWGPVPALARGALAAAVSDAGLTGRGGAGFPTGTKLAATAAQVARRPGCAPVVVANGMEGEPASRKDTALMTLAPHLVLDGIAAAALEIGARRAVLTVKAASPAIPALRAALAARRSARLGPAERVRVELLTPPSPYVSSQETSLVRWLDGGPAKPLVSPPRPSERGVSGEPTFLSNVETLAHIALIARFGPDWFRSVGTPAEPGSRLATLQGAFRSCGVHELTGGATVANAVDAAGGLAAPVAGYLVGGYFGRWFPTAESDPALIGCGMVLALPTTACPLRETARIVEWLAAQSAGQCGACRLGLPATAQSLSRLAAGQLDRPGYDTLRRWLTDLPGRGACHHPDGTAALVTSALSTFPDEVAQHLAGRCSAPRGVSVCPLPEIPRRVQWR